MTIVLPEVNFLTTDPDALTNELIFSYEELEGRKLAQADPLRIIFLSVASFITKQNIAINDGARQNLLYYAKDNVLDHKGAELRTPRLLETAAKTTMRFYVSENLTSSRIITKGALVTSNEAIVFFEAEEDTIIPLNTEYVDIEFICTTKGPSGNGFGLGQLNTLVKPLAFISKVENITVSNGGAEAESDDAYRERVHLAPESFSNAGSEGAYEYFAKSASALINDVYVYMPTPGLVNISVLLQNGELPTQEIIEAVYEKCNAKYVRPLTDFVTVEAPEIINYDLNVTYYIEANAVDKTLIHDKVTRAIDDYILWQASKIGRDINPSKLLSDIVKAGAKRADIVSPAFTVVNRGQVAQIANKTVVFGGVEDD